MDAVAVRECGCEACQRAEDSAVVAEHRRIHLLLGRLDEQHDVGSSRMSHSGLGLAAMCGSRGSPA
jgi:hypothetical protein